MPIEFDPETPFRVAGAGYLLGQCNRLAKHLPGVRLGDNPEDLHDVRVASRRLRSAMTVFRACFPPRQYRRWYGRVSELADALSDARDEDVQIELIGRIRESLSPEQQPGVDAWLAERFRSRDAARNKMIAMLDRWEADGALEGLREAFRSMAEARERVAREAADIEAAIMSRAVEEGADHA